MDQRLPEPAVTDWRGLCEELANHLQGRKDLECGWPGGDPEQDLIDRARAALAQPEPEVVGPSDEELDELFTEIDQSGEALSWRAFARAVLARWGHPAPAPAGEVAALARRLRMYCTPPNGPLSNDPDARWLTRAADLLEQRQATPVPVAVSERLPHPEDCDAEGRCWWWDGEWGLVEQRFTDYHVTHWLPANALPLPSGEATAAEIDGAQATGSTRLEIDQ